MEKHITELTISDNTQEKPEENKTKTVMIRRAKEEEKQTCIEKAETSIKHYFVK